MEKYVPESQHAEENLRAFGDIVLNFVWEYDWVKRTYEDLVIIDALAYYDGHKEVPPKVQPMAHKVSSYDVHMPISDETDVPEEEDESIDEEQSLQKTDYESLKERNERLEAMTDEQCVLANPQVRGMDLKTKELSVFFIKDLKDINWNTVLYPSLVLPDGEKELALAACKHKQTTEVDVDFVVGKGRGLILLLFGPPGVGKSLTAEAVAEELRVPLYSMTAGDLGTHPKTVESSVDLAFRRCTFWNAIMLLDEADVFLGSRSIEGLDRNELVSVFLRVLEHYQGILFLTTNRMDVIDPAFQSRIDFMIPYDNLTTGARREVWTNFVRRVGLERFAITDEDYNELANLNLNGREIKNLVKTSLLLALEAKTKVTMSHLQKLATMRIKAQNALSDHG